MRKLLLTIAIATIMAFGLNAQSNVSVLESVSGNRHVNSEPKPTLFIEQTDSRTTVFTEDFLEKELNCGFMSSNVSSNIIFSEGFEGTTGTNIPAGWTRSNSGGTPWNGAGAQTMVVPKSGSRMAYNIWIQAQRDAWLFSPGIELVAGTTYDIRFWAIIYGYPNQNDHFELKIGQSASIADMTHTLYYNINQRITVWTQIAVFFTPETSGTYYLGFHAFTPPGWGDYIAIDDVSVRTAVNNDLGITSSYQYTRIPVSQRLLPEYSAQVRNFGQSAQTDIAVTAELNGNGIGTSAPLSSLAAGSTATMGITSPGQSVILGENRLVYAVSQNETDENPDDNTFTVTFQGTENLYALESLTAHTLGIGAGDGPGSIGNIFDITEPTALSKVVVGFPNSSNSAIQTQAYSISLYSITSGLSLNPTPLFTQTANRVNNSFVTVDVPRRGLTPGRYFLCVNQLTSTTISISCDNLNQTKVFYTKNGNNLVTQSGYGVVVIRMIVADIVDIDGVVAEIKTPNSGMNLTNSEQVTILIQNFGDNPLTNFDLKLELNGTEVGTETYTDIIPPYSDVEYTFNTTVDVSETGTYEIKVTAIIDNDKIPENNTKTKTISNIVCPIVNVFPWNEGFENNGTSLPGCWTQEFVKNSRSWTLVTANSTYPAAAHSGTYMARFQNTSTTNHDITKLITRPIDLTGLPNPTLNFWHIQTAWSADQDQLRVYYKTSITGAWNLLAEYTTNVPAWTERTIRLPKPSNDYFIAFEGTAKYGRGIVIDDISIIEGEPYVDGELVSIVTPFTNEGLTTTEDVKVLIKNNGGIPLTSFDLILELDGNKVATETFTGLIESFGVKEYTFTTKLNLSVHGSYEIKVTLDIDDDIDLTNNHKTKKIGSFSSEVIEIMCYRIYDNVQDTNPYGFISFESNNPAVITRVNDYTPEVSGSILYAGEHLEGFFYAYTVHSNTPESFVKISTKSWETVASTPVSAVPHDMAYDYTTELMYGIPATSSTASNLVTVNTETGTMTNIGALGRRVVTLACSPQGNLFAIDANGNLCSINKSTGAATVIGSTGITPAYIQTMAFDQNTGRLFWAMFNSSLEGKLIEIDIATGITFDRGTIAGNAEIIGLYTKYREPEEYTITVSSDPTEGGTVSGGGTYRYGETVTVTTIPNTGYNFINWTEEGTQVSTDAEYSFTATENRALTAIFELITYIVNLEAFPSDGGTVTGSGTYPYGYELTVTATPLSNYYFVNWTKDDQELTTDPSYSFTVSENITLSANFSFVGIDEKEMANTFFMYPNPTKDKLILVGSTNQKALIEIYTSIGALVKSLEMNEQKIEVNVSSLNQGIYWIRLTNSHGSSTQRFVKE